MHPHPTRQDTQIHGIQNHPTNIPIDTNSTITIPSHHFNRHNQHQTSLPTPMLHTPALPGSLAQSPYNYLHPMQRFRPCHNMDHLKAPHQITPHSVRHPSIDPIIPTPSPSTSPFCYQPTHSATTYPNLPPSIHTLSHPTSIPNQPLIPPTPTITTYQQTHPNTLPLQH